MELVGNSVLEAFVWLVLAIGVVEFDWANGGEEVDELNCELADGCNSDEVPGNEVGTVAPEGKDTGGKDVPVDNQVLGAEEFGTVSIPGPLGLGELREERPGEEERREVGMMLDGVKKGVTVDGYDNELPNEGAVPDGERVALVNGPLVDIEAVGVFGSEPSLEVVSGDGTAVLELDIAELVGANVEIAPVLLLLLIVGPAGEIVTGIELPATVRDPLKLTKFELRDS